MRHKPSAHILAFLALFAALGGSAFAADPVRTAAVKLITGKQIRDDSLTGKDIKDRSLTARDFAGSGAGAPGPAGATGHSGTARTAGTPG